MATATWDLVLKRNSVERLKQEKSPLGMLDELPALIASGYEQVPEEDIVRLKWWGLYHDKPKVGTFMLRIKLPAGRASPAQLRTIGVLRDGEPGFAVRVGGGLSSVPRLARDLGVFVPKAQALDVLRALLDAWKEDLRYRVSRVKARMKFMVDDYGPEGMRAEVERRLGYRLDDLEAQPPVPIDDHMGVTRQREKGLLAVGVPVHLGLVSGPQLVAVADLADRLGGDVRITRQQNFVLTGVPEAELAAVEAELARIGFSLSANRVRAA